LPCQPVQIDRGLRGNSGSSEAAPGAGGEAHEALSAQAPGAQQGPKECPNATQKCLEKLQAGYWFAQLVFQKLDLKVGVNCLSAPPPPHHPLKPVPMAMIGAIKAAEFHCMGQSGNNTGPSERSYGPPPNRNPARPIVCTGCGGTAKSREITQSVGGLVMRNFQHRLIDRNPGRATGVTKEYFHRSSRTVNGAVGLSGVLPRLLSGNSPPRWAGLVGSWVLHIARRCASANWWAVPVTKK